MQSLRKNRFLHTLQLLLISGCTTSSYRIVNHTANRVEIKVTPDRLLLECEYQNDNDTNGLYGFMIHVLDDEKTILSVVQTNTLDNEGCLERLHKIGKILKKGNVIYLGGMGDLNEDRIKENRSYFIPKHGTYRGNGRMLQFMVIANERGDCYSAYRGDQKPCPRGEFPIKKK